MGMLIVEGGSFLYLARATMKVSNTVRESHDDSIKNYLYRRRFHHFC